MTGTDIDFAEVDFTSAFIAEGDVDWPLAVVAAVLPGAPQLRRSVEYHDESTSPPELVPRPCYRLGEHVKAPYLLPHETLWRLMIQANEVEQRSWEEQEIAEKTIDKKVSILAERLAREQIAAQDAEDDERFQQALAPVLLSDVEEPDVTWRIENLMQAGWVSLLWAQAKTGKSTLMINLIQALLSGKEFLGKFAVTALDPDQRVGVLNYEMTAANFKSWCQVHGVDLARVAVWNLRGMPNPLASELGRDRLVQELQAANAGFLLIDTYSRAMFAEKEEDNPAATKWFKQLGELLKAAGIAECVVTHHAGHQGDRLRGASALRDNPDCLWGMTRGSGSGGGGTDANTRFLAVEGRFMAGGGLERTALEFDPQTLTVTLGATAADQQADQEQAKGTASAVKDALEQNDQLEALLGLLPVQGQGPGLSSNEIYNARKAAGLEIDKSGQRLKKLVALSKGQVITGKGPRRGVHHWRAS